MVAIGGSRLRAVNTHEKNYTKGKRGARPMSRRASRAISPSLREPTGRRPARRRPVSRTLTERLASLHDLRRTRGDRPAAGNLPDERISLTDPDARAMATGGDHRGVVGYNVQAAVDTRHHIVVADAMPTAVMTARICWRWPQPPRLRPALSK